MCGGEGGARLGQRLSVCVWVETRAEMEKVCVCVGQNKGSNREIDR